MNFDILILTPYILQFLYTFPNFIDVIVTVDKDPEELQKLFQWHFNISDWLQIL